MSSSKLLYELKVYDDVSGDILGYVTSMSEDGLEMVTDQAIDLEKENFFVMDNILEMHPGSTVMFAAVCDQCAKEGENDHYHIKLTFTQLSSAADELKGVLH